MRRLTRFVPRLQCACCGGAHLIEDCEEEMPVPQRVPVETPGHSGEYRGTVPVRVIAQGVSGEDFGAKPFHARYREASLRGHQVQKRQRAERATCKRGHPMTPENTYMSPRGGKRYPNCRQCRRESDARRMKARNERKAQRRRERREAIASPPSRSQP